GGIELAGFEGFLAGLATIRLAGLLARLPRPASQPLGHRSHAFDEFLSAESLVAILIGMLQKLLEHRPATLGHFIERDLTVAIFVETFEHLLDVRHLPPAWACLARLFQRRRLPLFLEPGNELIAG